MSACGQVRTLAGLPYMGVAFQAHLDIGQVIKGESGPGIEILTVSPDSAAAQAHLLVGDIIVSIDGKSFRGKKRADIEGQFSRAIRDKRPGESMILKIVRARLEIIWEELDQTTVYSKDTWRAQDRRLLSMEPGDLIEMKARRPRRVMFKQVVLGKRPDPAALVAAPSQAELFPERIDWQDDLSVFVDHLAELEEVAPVKDDLWTRFAQDENNPVLGRLNEVRFLHRQPEKTFMVMQDWQDQLFENHMGFALSSLSEMMDTPVVMTHIPQLTADLTSSFSDLFERYHRAPPEYTLDKNEVRRSLLSLRDFMIPGIGMMPSAARDEGELHASLVTADPTHWVQAACELGHVLDEHFMKQLRSYKGARRQWETPYGLFVLGSAGDDTYREDCALILDPGGNDLYMNNVGSNTADMKMALVIDAAGNDRYYPTEHSGVAHGFFGLGMVIDLEGHDRYLGREWVGGVGVAGVGILWDHSGNDLYVGNALGQGLGVRGLGLLRDDAGDDLYEMTLMGQGVGFAAGLGCLLDRRGNDQYTMRGRYPSSYGTKGITRGCGQGFGLGARGQSSGGIGLLVDALGDDHYLGGNFSQGCGYYFALGALLDRDGKDRYVSTRYTQGSSAHSACGVLWDQGTHPDIYEATQGSAQGAAWDIGCGLLRDDGGADSYTVGIYSAQASGDHNGFGLLWDRGGADRYEYEPGRARAAKNSYHGGFNLALFLDEGPGEDTKTQGLEALIELSRPGLGMLFNRTAALSDWDYEQLPVMLTINPYP